MKKYNEFRNIEKMVSSNDGTRTLYESVIFPEIIKALKDFIENKLENCVLIGGLALSFYVKPRMTQDIDILFLSKEDIPDKLDKFKRNRNGAFQHDITHVEVETVIPSTINLREDLAQVIFNTSVVHDGIRIASPSGLIVSKLSRFNRRDQADIEELKITQDIDLSPFNLTKEELDKYNSIV